MGSIEIIMGRITTFLINPAIMVIFACGFMLFVWGLVEFLWKLKDGADNEDGKQHMLWGVIGMFIMVSVYGILSILNNTFGLGVSSLYSY